MICPRCGTSSPDQSRFCPGCGGALTPIGGRGGWYVLAGSVILGLGLLIALIVVGGPLIQATLAGQAVAPSVVVLPVPTNTPRPHAQTATLPPPTSTPIPAIVIATPPTGTVPPVAAPTSTPIPAIVAAPSSTPATLPLFPRDRLLAALQPAGGSAGVLVYDVASGTLVMQQQPDQVFPAASLIKLPIVLTVYQLAQQGQLDLSQTITMRASDKVGGTGSLQNQPDGSSYQISDLCDRMLRESDNTAGNLILGRIGFAAVNSTMDALGAPQTRVRRLFLDEAARRAGRENTTTPRDMLHLLQIVQQGSGIDPTARLAILTAMQHNVDRTMLPALLPPQTIIAHKVGSLLAIQHDVGIVELSGRTYLVVLMTQNLSSNAAGITALAQASLVIYTYEQQLPAAALSPAQALDG